MEKSEMLSGLKTMKSKLMAAVSMLLVSAILLSNTTYAWFVLSTSPEVTGVETTTGSNGALEIALLSTDTTGAGGIANIGSGRGTSSAVTGSVTESNITWGNIVNLSKEYGLEGVTLYPSRLNLNTSYNGVSTASYLSVPQYGSDGRVSALKDTVKTHYDPGASKFTAQPVYYGVNVLGFEKGIGSSEKITSLLERETLRIEAVDKVYALRSELRADLQESIHANSAGIVSLMFWTQNITEPLDEAERKTVVSLVTSMNAIATQATQSLRWALLAYCLSDTDTYPAEASTDEEREKMKELGEIYQNFLTMDLVSDEEGDMTISSLAEKYPQLSAAVDLMIETQSTMANAMELVTRDEGESEEEYNSDLLVAGSKLVNVDTAFIECGEFGYFDVPMGIQYAMQFEDWENDLYFIGTSDLSTAGLFPVMASIVGDYSAEIYVKEDENENFVNAESYQAAEIVYHMKATSQYHINGSADSIALYEEFVYDEKTNTGTGNGGVLMDVYIDTVDEEAEGEIPVTIERFDVSAYGYSVDLAFRSSKAGNLVLQQTASSRVENPYAVGDEEGTATDDENADETEEEREERLIQEGLQGGGSHMSFRVIGNMTTAQAARLTESIYIVLVNPISGSIYAVAKPANIQAEFGMIEADLQLYKLNTTAMANNKDGVLVLDDAIDGNVITPLAKDTITYVSAIVYLNGDTVSGMDVAPQGLSIEGKINLQFALDGATLVPMSNAAYLAPEQEDGN